MVLNTFDELLLKNDNTYSDLMWVMKLSHSDPRNFQDSEDFAFMNH